MTYPPVIQHETRAREAESQARLARERRAARSAIGSRRRPSWRALFGRRAPACQPGSSVSV